MYVYERPPVIFLYLIGKIAAGTNSYYLQCFELTAGFVPLRVSLSVVDMNSPCRVGFDGFFFSPVRLSCTVTSIYLILRSQRSTLLSHAF